jgi:DNA modification methylase
MDRRGKYLEGEGQVKATVNNCSLYLGNSLKVLPTLPDNLGVQCLVTSPPYFNVRDYKHKEQIGLEKTPEEYIENLVKIFRECKRLLREDATLWVNIGDSYKDKNLIGVPWMLAFAMKADGWCWRQEIIWQKTCPMAESVKDRPHKSHEVILFFAKSSKYYYDILADTVPYSQASVSRAQYPIIAISGKGVVRQAGEKCPKGTDIKAKKQLKLKEEGRALWSVWGDLTTEPSTLDHFALMPPSLAKRCIKLSTSQKGCCSACRSPYIRQVEKERKPTRPGKNTKVKEKGLAIGNRDPERHVTESTTVGWLPSCSCNAEVVPCLVMDPFGGAFTTGLAAQRLGRAFLGVELNPEYFDTGVERLKRRGKLNGKALNKSDKGGLFNW